MGEGRRYGLVMRSLGILLLVVLLATACGGGSSDEPGAPGASGEGEGDAIPTGPAAPEDVGEVDVAPGDEASGNENDEPQADPPDGPPTGLADGGEITAFTTSFGDELPVAFLAPTNYDEATCNAAATWNQAYEALPGDAISVASDFSPLLAAADAVDRVAEGEIAIYLNAWTSNLQARQLLLESVSDSGETRSELEDQLRALGDELDIYDGDGILSRYRRHCVRSLDRDLRSDANYLSSVPIEAPDTVVLTQDLAFELETLDLEITDFRMAAIWADPWFGLGIRDEYKPTRDPYIYVDFTLANASSRAFDMWRGLPFELRAPGGAGFGANDFQSADYDPPVPRARRG